MSNGSLWAPTRPRVSFLGFDQIQSNADVPKRPDLAGGSSKIHSLASLLVPLDAPKRRAHPDRYVTPPPPNISINIS